MVNDNHIEWNIDDGGTSIVTLSAGVGQAQGLFTVQQTGRYVIDYSVRMGINEGQAYFELRQHPGTSALLDINGNPLETQLSDNAGTNDCECTNNSSVFDLTSGDVIKVAWILIANAIEVSEEYTAFTMMRIG